MLAAIPPRQLGVLVLCAFSALLEGFDVGSMGVAAPKLVPAFGLTLGQAGLVFSATTLGLFFGAMLGGRAADLIGRKQALIVALLVFGACSWVTPFTTGYVSLLVARFITGLGLGAAMPNFITLASESSPAERRLSVVTIIMAGLPFGGCLASLVALLNGFGFGWQGIFYVGGLLPILIALAVIWVIPADRASAQNTVATNVVSEAPAVSVFTTLFGGSQKSTTLLLWTSFFFTQIVLLLLLNWLPSLMRMSGFSHERASAIQIAFNFVGGIASLFLGRLQEGRQRSAWVLITYVGVALTLIGVGAAKGDFWLALLAAAVAGGFVVSAQMVLYALPPLYYPAATRGTGVGAAVAAGRLGSVVGPVFAGALLSAGGTAASVMLAIEPFVLVAGAAAFALSKRKRLGE